MSLDQPTHPSSGSWNCVDFMIEVFGCSSFFLVTDIFFVVVVILV